MKDWVSKKRERDSIDKISSSKKYKKENLASQKSNETSDKDVIGPPFFISNFRYHSIKNFEEILELPLNRNAKIQSLHRLLNEPLS